ncbi:MAG: Eco57I restriction-modification methylase domain-containing protein [Candidatus Moraniibacteriota bacterium]
MKNQTNYNPDVLSCLANLSNDEVFTPPALVNQILDLLPAELWKNKEAKFLDPVSKSGVFLREIVQRLLIGLEKEIPDHQKRLNHIYQNQVFGIGITELTSLLSRRSVYCSKTANGKYSVCDNFQNEQGNIIFDRTEHLWENGKCKFCGASQAEYDRGEQLETHAYQFIHTNEPAKIFNDMKFDVIIGNPPYQLNDGGGRDSGAVPLYHKFILQAKKLNPRYLSMIIPARWYSGGKGLDEFRDEMLNDIRVSQIHDFPETADCFPGLNIRGGICFFLWDRENKLTSKIVNYKSGKVVSEVNRSLLEANASVFIRYNEAISILKKVSKFKESTYNNIVSSRKPFGLNSNFSGFTKEKTEKNNITLYKVGGIGFMNENKILTKKELIKKIKILVSKASPGGDTYPHKIISSPIIALQNSCCTETYLIIDVVKNLKQAKNLTAYMKTRFFRFMMSLVKNTQNISRGVFAFVPVQDLNEEWTDEKLYKKYGINKEEQVFIDSLILPME